MAGGNPFAPLGANPGGPVPQGGTSQGPLGQSASSAGPGRGRMTEVGRAPFNGAGASILVPGGGMQPPSGQGPSNAVPPSKQGDPFADIHQNFRQVKSRYDDGVKAQQVLDHLRVELDQLMDKGDTVRPEHVIEAAGRLVGHGLGATQLAQIMSDMPATGGEGLASWIRMHDVTISNAEQQLSRANDILRNRLGVAGIRALSADHVVQTVKHAQEGIPEQGIPPVGGSAPMGGGEGNGLTSPGGDNA